MGSKLRYVIQSVLALVLVGYFSASYALTVPVVNTFFKEKIQDVLSRSFERDITIGEMEGSLLSLIVAKNVVLFNREGYSQDIFATVEQMNIYTSFRVVFGGLLSAILKVDFDQVVLNIERNANKQVNILEFSKLGKATGGAGFEGKLTFYGISGQYVDGNSVGTEGFRQAFYRGDAVISFNKGTGISIDASMLLEDTQAVSRFNGEFLFKEREFQYSFSLDAVDASLWGDYLVPGQFFKFGPQFVLIEGKLLSEYTNANQRPVFKYDIDFFFNDLQLMYSKWSVPVEQIRGVVGVTNLEGEPQLLVENVHGVVSGHDVQAVGTVLFKERRYDVAISPNEPIPLQDFLQFAAIEPEFIPNVVATVNVGIKGTFDQPLITTKLYNDSININGYSLGKIYVGVDYFNKQLVFKSLLGSDVVVSGNVLNNVVDADVFLSGMTVPLIVTPQAVELNITGFVSSPSIYASLDIVQKFYGFDVDKIDMHVSFLNNQWRFSNGGVHFLNGQSILYDGVLDSDAQKVSFVQAPFKSNVVLFNGPRVDKVMSNFLLDFSDNDIKMAGHLEVTGQEAIIEDITVDIYDIVVDIDGAKKVLDVRKAVSGQQSLYGLVKLDGDIIYQSKLWFRSFDLSLLNDVFPTYNQYDISGIATGHLFYTQTDDMPDIEADVNIEQLVSVFGLFGRVSATFITEDDALNIQFLKLSGEHSGVFKGKFRSLRSYEMHTVRYSLFNLSALNFFRDRSLVGKLGVEGGLVRQKDDWTYNGVVEFKDLAMDGVSFPYVGISGKYSDGKADIKQAKVVFDEGEIVATGFVSGMEQPTVNMRSLGYDLDIQFKGFQLDSISTLLHGYDKLWTFNQSGNLASFINLDHQMLYSKYNDHGVRQFYQYVSTVKEKERIRDKVPIVGDATGTIKLSSKGKRISFTAFNLRDVVWKDWLSVDRVAFRSSKQGEHRIQGKNVVFYGNKMDDFASIIKYNTQANELILMDMDIKYKDRQLHDFLGIRYSFKERYLDAKVVLKGADINLVSFFVSEVQEIQNKGVVKMQLKGPLDNVDVTFPIISLNQFSMVFNPKHSFFNSRAMVNKFSTTLTKNVLSLDGLALDWVGSDTYRRVTRAEKVNKIEFLGGIRVDSINFLDQAVVGVDYNLMFRPTFLSINFPNIYTGDIVFSSSTIKGAQRYPLTLKGRVDVIKTLGSDLEEGPVFSSSMVFQDGVFNLPKAKTAFSNIRLGLDLHVTVGEAMYLQGSIFGDGLYNLANRVALEVSPVMKKEPIHVTGMLNGVQYTSKIIFYDGSMSMFDGVYTLLNNAKQRHYFKEIPEFISEQYVEVYPKYSHGKRGLEFSMHLNAMWIKDGTTHLDNVDSRALYDGVVIVFDGSLDKILSDFTVIEFGVDSPYVMYPNYEMRGVHSVRLFDQDEKTRGANYGLNLIMPGFLTDESANFSHYGRQQVNTFVHSSIRPYERRLAKRVGLYDLRVDYDFGRTLFYSDYRQESYTDLLGVTLTSNLYKEKLFLNVRSDYNLSPETNVEAVNGVKLTQVEFKYFMSDQLTLGLKNVNEYSEVMTFDPRLSLSYGYVF
jgi:hypothetical protein